MGRATSPLRDRVIFVDGAPRSGTTWLVTLLATHAQIAGVQAESHLFDFGTDRLFDNVENRNPNLHGLRLYLDREELVDLVRDLCDGVLMAMRSHVSPGTEPEFVVEKTPVGARADGLDLERKRDCYPDAWYIHIVRDREAVAASLMRSPFMADRSHQACAGLWDRVVGDIRRCLGDAPRYREVSYERLRADPAATCAELFAWLGVDAGPEALALVERLSLERYSEMGAAPPPRPRGRFARPRRAIEHVPAAARAVRRRVAPAPAVPPPEEAVAFYLARALRERDADALRALSAPNMEFVLRCAGGDVVAHADAARDALVELAEGAFAHRNVGDWWASGSVGAGDWWTSEPGTPFCSVFFSGLAGDASRTDIALGIVPQGGLIRRLLVVSAAAPASAPAPARFSRLIRHA